MIEYKLSPSAGGERRDTLKSMGRGLMGRCPHCGEGKMFRSYLRTVHECSACGEELDLHRADDLPAYVVILIVGHIVVGLNLAFEQAADWPLWVHFAIWPLLALVMTLGLLQPIKGALIGYQWALRLHGFDHHGDAPATPAIVKTP